MENIFSSFAFSAQGLSVQRMRLSSVAKNIANADTTRDERGQVYRREVVIVRALQRTQFDDLLQQSLPLARSMPSHVDPETPGLRPPNDQILKAQVARDNSPPRLVYDPTHPDADSDGYVRMPNVNIVTEMVEMISAQRAFEANTAVISAAKNIARDSLEI
ncbi:MAG: flagellar basal body rod protein FlgC [Bacteroidota bacterium]|nr:flagellar basal body rod protein FlgC [Candidatus Kapabacteria bacterium]MCS7302766.1 flagellar basal body rod protein FlgC [Candidatus Kapabacteria bacterium]MCX7937004.1 flagellar basal body rod protein FlgC [Chlorobiota bacterium]MDW8075475.1 flagellar basal body rod protein FlgC [Bacteroidota bacterium]MDW8272332.1 flagellar basal body rod protein FlgC [Bacteroidota bacterium]